jgi:glycosyltransferase involved in cell wall biosynthesis
MRIGIDYTAAAWQGAGIGRYTRELVRATVALAPDLTFRLFYAAGGLPANSLYRADLAALCAQNPQVSGVPIPFTPRQLTILWQRLRVPLPVETFIGSVDLLHAPDFVLPPTRAHRLLTIHDLTFLVRPECAEPGLRRYLSAAVPRAVRQADRILVDSRATGADLVRLIGADPAKLRLVYPGVGPQFRPLPRAECEELRTRIGLPQRFVLFVSTLEPRKNVPRLLEAFAMLPGLGDFADMKLVLAGRKGWLYDAIFATIERLRLRERVLLLDFVADRDLPVLYNLAEVFAYPSLYEGFGLPALEALACGTPVLSAAVASLPEVVGHAGILVDPLDSRAIARGLVDAIAEAARLRRAGPLQAATFSWEQAAQDLIAVYRDIV